MQADRPSVILALIATLNNTGVTVLVAVVIVVSPAAVAVTSRQKQLDQQHAPITLSSDLSYVGGATGLAPQPYPGQNTAGSAIVN